MKGECYFENSAKFSPNSNSSPVSVSTQATLNQRSSFHKRGTTFSNFSSPTSNNSNLNIIDIISDKEKELIGADIRLMGYLKRSIDKVLTGIDSPMTRKSGTQRSLVSMSPMSGFYDQGESFDDGYNRAQNNPFNSPYSVRSFAQDGSWTPYQEEVEKRANSGMNHRRSCSGIVPGVIDTKNKNVQNERSYENFETFSAYENEMDSSREIKKKKKEGKFKNKHGTGKKIFESSLENSEESFSNRIHFLESSKKSAMNSTSAKQKSNIVKNPQKQVEHFAQQQHSLVSDRYKKRSTLENYLEYQNYQSPTNLGYSQQRVHYYDSPNSGKGSPVRMKNKQKNSPQSIDNKLKNSMNEDGLKEIVRELDNIHFGMDKTKESRTQGNLVLGEAEARLRKSFSSFRNIQYD